jgi:HSP20 family protein
MCKILSNTHTIYSMVDLEKMSSGDIEPYDWYRRFLGRGRGGFFEDVFRGFDQMRREMEHEFEDIEKTVPKDLVREYDTPQEGKVREVGPLVYGYSMTVGPDGKPKVKEFGNIKPSKRIGFGTGLSRPEISGEMEPLTDVTTADKEIKVIIDMPGLSKDKIKVEVYENKVEVKSDDPQRKYRKIVELLPEADIESARCAYNNGILEITFNKKEQAKAKGKTIKIE